MRNTKEGMYNNLIDSKVRQMQFQEDFKPFIAEILKRRAIQFDFTEDQVELDLDRLSKSLTIFTAKNDELSTAGTYYQYDKKINLNPISADFSSAKSVFATLTHEVYHALAVENGHDTMAGINTHTGQYNGSLLETIVEKAAFQTVYPVKTKDPYYHKNNNGYEMMTFATSMLAATFGMNETEFLGHAIQGRDRLISYLAEKTHRNDFEMRDFLDTFEMNLSVVHNNCYGTRKTKDKQYVRGKNNAEAVGRMKKACANMMIMNLEAVPDEELTPEKIEDLKYNFNKLNEVVKKGTAPMRHSYSNFGFSMKRIDVIGMQAMEDLANAIVQTECLTEAKRTTQLPEAFKKYEPWARYGNLGHFDTDPFRYGLEGKTLADLGIMIPLKRLTGRDNFDISRETIERNQIPKEKTERWDNSIVRRNHLKFKIFKTHIKGNFDAVKGLVSKVGKKLLPAGSNSGQEEKKEETYTFIPNDEKAVWHITKEKVDEINSNSANIVNNMGDPNRENKGKHFDNNSRNDSR